MKMANHIVHKLIIFCAILACEHSCFYFKLEALNYMCIYRGSNFNLKLSMCALFTPIQLQCRTYMLTVSNTGWAEKGNSKFDQQY